MIGRLWASSLGDYVAGSATAVLVGIAVHGLVDPTWDVVVAVLVGSAVGMAVHFVVLLALGSLVGLFQVMIPGSLIGMYGGMLFGMRDAMQRASWSRVVIVSLVFGILVVALCQTYDWALRAASASRR
jgi:hypothetical protein